MAHHRCEICDGVLELALEVRRHEVFECPACRHRQLERLEDLHSHLEQIYSDQYFEGGEDGYSDYLASQPLLETRGEEIRSLLERHGLSSTAPDQTGSVLDIGCAAGFLLSPFRQAGYQTVGVEPNSKIAEVAQRSLDCPIFIGGCESFLADTGQTFDAILLVQVIAHLDRPAAVVQQLASRLATGGLLFVETWDYESLASRLFGRRWHEYRPPSVRHWFTRHSLDELADRAGLVKAEGGTVWKWLQWQHARGLLAHSLQNDLEMPRLARVFSTLAGLVPGRFALPYPGDDAFWALYRKTAS